MNNAAMEDAQLESDAACAPFTGSFGDWLSSMTDQQARQALITALDDMPLEHGDMAETLAGFADQCLSYEHRSPRFNTAAGEFIAFALEALRVQYAAEVES